MINKPKIKQVNFYNQIPTLLDKHYAFIKDVKEHPERYGKSLQMCVRRYEHDLKRDDVYFDKAIASYHLEFIGIIPLVDAEWAGTTMDTEMQPWQCFFFASLYGWRMTATKKRRFTDVYLQMPKKNGKTTMAAIIAIDSAVNDGLPGAQIYFAGYSMDTANICFQFSKRMCQSMMSLYPSLEGKIKLWSHSVEFKHKDQIFLRKVSSDANSLEGKGPRCSIVDEVHTHPNGQVIENLRSGSALYVDPLMVQITTPGFDKNGPAFQKYTHSKNVLEGVIDDDHLFPMLLEPDDEDDWNNESTWAKSNLNIGISPKWEFLRAEYNVAKLQGGLKEVSFKIKHCGMWTDSDVVWISDDVWMANQYNGSLPSVAYGGLDLAIIHDFSVITWTHVRSEYMEVNETDEHGDEVLVNKEVKYLYQVYHIYYPEESVNNHKLMDVKKWAKEGHITVTPGRSTDYRVIKNDIIAYAKKYTVPMIYYDQFNATELVSDLVEAGIPMEPYAQYARYLNVPTREFEKAVLEKRLHHNGNPVMRWMMKNVRLVEDNNGNVKIRKDKSKDAVDGPVSAVMSVAAVLNGKEETHTPGFLIIDIDE